MTKEEYIKLTKPFRDNPKMAWRLHMLNKFCTGIMYILYPCFLVYLSRYKSEKILQAVLVPGISFLLLSVGRYAVNRKRPYEAFEMLPVIPKSTKGKSFPSRHVFSSMIIAMTILIFFPWKWVGISLLLITIVEAVIRVLSGVHYVSDVVVGFLIGLLVALVYFVL